MTIQQSIRRSLGYRKAINRSKSNDASPSEPAFLRNPLQWYGHKLDTSPVLTKCITSGTISGSGDVLCQYLNRSDGNFGFDWIRSMRFAILGSFLVAPTVHAWYGLLMTRIPGTSVKAIGKRLFFDQGLFAPVFTPTFISCLTVLEHVTGDKTNDNDGDTFALHFTDRLRGSPEAIVMGWKIWVPSMAVMFAVVPSKYQVLYSNCVGFVWNAYLSWKTHEGEATNKMES